MDKQINIDTKALKEKASLIPYVQKFYPDRIQIEKETDDVCFAKCVFHEEKTASLALYRNGSFKCFGCGEHGDIITLVQKLENINFQEACVLIANNIGFKIEYVNVNPNWETYKDIMTNHNRRYWTNLANNSNPEAIKYLTEERGLTVDTINEFRLGVTDVDEYKYRTDMGNISNCIAFPLLEPTVFSPKCVGMSYKPLDDSSAKYINDKNQSGRDGQDPLLSGVFVKGNILYGFSQAYKSIIENDFVFVVEGYFDVMSLHQAGIKNVVGLMGTSLTDVQLAILLKTTKNIFLFLDNDNAGLKAMEKIIYRLAPFAQTTICLMKENYNDPDELCRTNNFNRSAILDSMNVVDGVHYIISKETKEYKDIVSRERLKTMNKLYPLIDLVANKSSKEAYRMELENEMR